MIATMTTTLTTSTTTGPFCRAFKYKLGIEQHMLEFELPVGRDVGDVHLRWLLRKRSETVLREDELVRALRELDDACLVLRRAPLQADLDIEARDKGRETHLDRLK